MGPESEAEIIALLKDVQKQLTYLEKKVDALSRGAGSRPTPGRSAAPERRFAQREEGAFAPFKNKRAGRPAAKGRGLPGSTYPKKNQSYKPKKKKK